MTDPLTPVLSINWADERAWTMDAYQRQGGYRSVPTAIAMGADAVISAVKDAGLRGRGGAGFPTATKWAFLPPQGERHRFLVVNADESEPGTCKDIPLMLASPHTLVEGVIT